VTNLIAYFLKDPKKLTNQKLAIDFTKNIVNLIDLCSMNILPFKEMLNVAKELVGSTNAAIRKESIELFKKMYS